MNKLIYLKDVVTLKLDEAKCTGCGMCLEVCPHAVFQMNTRHVEIRDRDACMECGACSRNCPFDAISVQDRRRLRGGRDRRHAGPHGSAVLRSERLRMLFPCREEDDLLRVGL